MLLLITERDQNSSTDPSYFSTRSAISGDTVAPDARTVSPRARRPLATTRSANKTIHMMSTTSLFSALYMIRSTSFQEVDMKFTKEQMQQELLLFLAGFGEQFMSLCSDTREIQSEQSLATSLVVQVVSEMYDYGICGIPKRDLGVGDRITQSQNRVEMFLQAVDTVPMRLFLADKEIDPPRLAIRVVQTAVARAVLDGAQRYTDYMVDELGVGNGDFGYLTVAEIALLANMDERSVRNAANPRLPGALQTVTVGRRALVMPDEARRWLAGRKGFIPTQRNSIVLNDAHQEFNLELPREILEVIYREAKDAGIPFTHHMRNRLITIAKEIKK